MHPQRVHLLGRASEDRRVAAFQPHHPFAIERRANEQGVDHLLALRVATGALADGDADDMCRDQIEDRGTDQRIVENDAGGFDQADGLQGQQLWVAGSGTDQPDVAGRNEIRHGRPPYGPQASARWRGGTIRNWCPH